MRVLFLTYPKIGLNRGGLQIQIEETAKGLAELGIEVVFYDPWSNQIPEVDLCHAFSVDGSIWSHLERARSLGKPVVVSTVFNLFQSYAAVTTLKRLASTYLPGVYSDLRRAYLIVQSASKVIALNENERHLLRQVFSLPDQNIVIVPNGIPNDFASADPAVFSERYGVKEFVLNVASIEERKNQLMLIRAMRGLSYPLVIIGKVRPENEAYLAACREAAGEQVVFVGGVPHDSPLLASAYRAAKLFALPSHSEVMPLALYEAAAAGCRVIVSHSVPLEASLQNLVPRFDPRSCDELRALVTREMERPRGVELQSAMQHFPTWGKVCMQIHAIYRSVLDH